MLNVCTGVNIDVGLEVAEIPAKFFRFSGEMASGKHDPATKGTNRPECKSKLVLEKDSISRTPKTCISNSQMHATIERHEISKVGQGSRHNASHGNAMIFSWLLSSLDSSNGLDTVSAAVTH